MRFVVQQSQLLAAFADIIGVVPMRSTFTILTNVLMEALEEAVRLTATDLDTFVSIQIPATVQEGGSLTAPARMLMELTRELDDEPITFYTEDETLFISASSGNFSVQGIARTEFPQVDLTPPGDPHFRLRGEDLTGLIRPVQFASSTEESRMILNGVFIKSKDDKIVAAATDGHRLGFKSLERVPPPVLEKGIVIPNKVIGHVLHLAGLCTGEEVEIWVTARNILLHGKGRILYARLVEGTYPAFEHVVPKNQPYRLEMDTDKLLSSIRRANVMANATTHQIRLTLGADEVSVAAANPNKGSTALDRAPATYEGEPMDISFNGRYLLEIIKQIPSSRVRITLEGPTQATLFFPTEQAAEDEEYFCLLMPLRI